MKVPLGTYELRYAVGQSWINDEEYFGKETTYLKADKKLTFSSDGAEVRGVAVELILQRNGNLSTSRISKLAF